jgi:hypothetical protein
VPICNFLVSADPLTNSGNTIADVIKKYDRMNPERKKKRERKRKREGAGW